MRFGLRCVPISFSAERLRMLMQPVAVDADHAGAGAGEHRLGEAAAAVDHVARAHDVVALGAQFLRHPVEGLAELARDRLPSARTGTCT